MKKILICLLASSLMFSVSACAPRHHKSCGNHGGIEHGKKDCHAKKKCDCVECQSKKKCPYAK